MSAPPQPQLAALIQTLPTLACSQPDRLRISQALASLDQRYALAYKIVREPGLTDIVQQLFSRLLRAYPDLSSLSGQRILDIACGSNTSRAPAFVYINSPFGERKISIPHVEGYTAQFEPWFCRILLELSALPVGVDLGNLDSEAFEHHKIDLGRAGALDIFPSRSFDALQDSRLFGSPEFTAQFPDSAARLKVAEEIHRQEQRLLKPGGIIIHSDAAALAGSIS